MVLNKLKHLQSFSFIFLKKLSYKEGVRFGELEVEEKKTTRFILGTFDLWNT